MERAKLTSIESQISTLSRLASANGIPTNGVTQPRLRRQLRNRGWQLHGRLLPPLPPLRLERVRGAQAGGRGHGQASRGEGHFVVSFIIYNYIIFYIRLS